MYDTTGARMTAQVWTGRDFSRTPLATDAVTAVPTALPAAPARRVSLRERIVRIIRGGSTTSRFAPA